MLETGTVIQDRYRIESVLGEGGFGVVYEALQLSTKQKVAVKVLLAEKLIGNQAAELEVQRFEREMELIAQLKHPNIVRLIDSGKLDDDELYTVLEFVEGMELAQLVKEQGALAPRMARDLMFQVLDALSAAHDLGIVHRDMKPQNIMVTTQGFRRNAMVLDFGIAGIAEDARNEDYRTLTMEGRIHGTPAYMAPEQLRGERTSAQIDIYAWALVFLEALTGRSAIDGGTLADTIAQVVSPLPVPIPEPLASHPLGHFLHKALAKDQDARFQTADEALTALDKVDVPAEFEFPWTGTSATDEQMASASISGPMAAQPGIHGESTLALDADGTSVSGPVQEQPDTSGAGGLGMILGVVAILVLVAGGVLAWLLVGGSDDAGENEAEAAATQDEGAGETPTGTEGVGTGTKDETAEAPARESSPSFEKGDVVAVEGSKGPPLHYASGGPFSLGADKTTLAQTIALCKDLIGRKNAKYCKSFFKDQTPQKSLELEPFLIDETEVTQAHYSACVEAGTCAAPRFEPCLAMTQEGFFKPHGLEGEHLEALEKALTGDKLPVVCITRDEAAAYCAWAGKRLPTEAEFEFAATQGGKTLFPWGGQPTRGGRKANGAELSLTEAMGWGKKAPIVARTGATDVDGYAFLAPVASFPEGKAPLGVHDLAGNVREWVDGSYEPYGDKTELDEKKVGKAVARGGSWADNGPWLGGRSRYAVDAETRRTDLGFRCARAVPEPNDE